MRTKIFLSVIISLVLPCILLGYENEVELLFHLKNYDLKKMYIGVQIPKECILNKHVDELLISYSHISENNWIDVPVKLINKGQIKLPTDQIKIKNVYYYAISPDSIFNLKNALKSFPNRLEPLKNKYHFSIYFPLPIRCAEDDQQLLTVFLYLINSDNLNSLPKNKLRLLLNTPYLAGTVEYNNANYKKAIQYFQKALTLEPKNKKILNDLYFSYKATSDWENANLFFKQFINQYQNNQDALRTLIVINSRLSNFGEVVEKANQFLSINSKDISVLRILAFAYLRLDDLSNAIKIYNDLLLEDKNPQNRKEIMLMLGDFYFQNGEYIESKKMLIQFENIFSRSAQSQFFLGRAYLGTGELKKAEQCFSLAIAMDKSFEDGKEVLGKMIFLFGHYHLKNKKVVIGNLFLNRSCELGYDKACQILGKTLIKTGQTN